MKKRQTHPLLQDKLVHLGLVLICNKWSYNPFNDLLHEHIKVTHSPQPYWEKRHNPLEDEDELLVDLIHIQIEDSRPPWNKFYFVVVDYKENWKMGATLFNELRREHEWSIEKIRAFWVYRQEKKQLDAPYESMLDDEKFENLRDDEHPTSDSSASEGDESNEEEEEAEEEVKTLTSSAQQNKRSIGQPAYVTSNVWLNI